MSITIVVSPTVRFKVEGMETAEDGSDKSFTFWLTAERLADSTQVVALQKQVREVEMAGSETPITDALLPKLRGWNGPKTPEGQDVPFSEDACRALLNRPGMAARTFAAYISAVGVRAKN